MMTKSEMAKKLAEMWGGLSSRQVNDNLDSLVAFITKTVKKDKVLKIANLGTFRLRQLKARTPELLPRTIVLTVATEVTSRDCPELLEIAAFLRKPVDIDVLATTIYACADAVSPRPDQKRAGGLETTIRR